MTVLIDSWAWIEYFLGSPAGQKARKHVEGEEPAVVSSVNVAEVFRWCLKNRSPPEADQAFRIMVRRCSIIPVDAALARRAAEVKHEQGWGLGDSIVWATAEIAKATLLTGDPDFEGLSDVDWIGLS